MASKAVIDTLIAEAGGEGEEGLIAAAWAIQQRAAANGVSIDKVVRSGFDGFTNPGSGAVKAQADPALRARVEQIMSGVESGEIPNPVPRADHFLSGDVMPSWAKGMELVATVGGHRFYASGKVPESAVGNSVGAKLDVARPAPTPAVASRAVTVARNQQNLTPAADAGNTTRTAAASFLTRDGAGVTSPVDTVMGKEMTTRLPSGVSASDKARGQSGTKPQPPSPPRPPVAPRRYTPGSAPTPPAAPVKPSASDKARAAAVAPRAVTPPSSGKSASSNIASARSEQAAARGPKPAAVIAAQSLIPGPNAPVKSQERLPSVLLAHTTPSIVQPTQAQLEAGTGFRLPGTLLGGAAPVPAAQSAAMIAARKPKAVAPVPAVRAAAPVAVAPRKATPVPVARVPAPAIAAITGVSTGSVTDLQRRASEAVALSGDDSVGNQKDAADARASGSGGRTRRY